MKSKYMQQFASNSEQKAVWLMEIEMHNAR